MSSRPASMEITKQSLIGLGKKILMGFGALFLISIAIVMIMGD